MKNVVKFYGEQLVLVLAALPLGVAAGAVCALFGRVLLAITDFRMAHYIWFLPFLGLVGAGIIWCYRTFGGESLKGMSLLFEHHQGKRQDIPLRLVPMVMAGTWLTHLFGGSAGREGVAVQIGGTIGAFEGGLLPVPNARRFLMIAGMAAGFGGLFRTPMAATFFACEVLMAGAFEYGAILPSLAGAFTASYVSGALGLSKFSVELTDAFTVDGLTILKLLIAGIAFGLTGWVFASFLQRFKVIFADKFHNPLVRIGVVGTAVGLMSIICLGGRYSGLGTNLIAMSFSEGILPWDFILKLLFTVITLGCGFLGGEVTPLFAIGASLGIVLAPGLQLPLMLCAALGYAAVFGSATNTLVAPMIIGVEVFGLNYLPAFFVVCVTAYMFNGNQSIYSLQQKKIKKRI